MQPQWVGSKYPTHSIHIGAHVCLSGAKFAWAKNEVLTYLDGNLFNLQFRGRGDIPDSSEGGQKEILGRNLRNPLGADCIPGSGGEAGVFAVEVGTRVTQ